MNNTLDSSFYEIIRDESSESFIPLSEKSDKQVSKITSNELLQVPSQGIKVYLRFKPENDCENKLQDETYSVVSQSTLLTKFPNTVKKSARSVKKSKIRDNQTVAKKIKFTQIFDSGVSQESIFQQSIEPEIAQFLSGQNMTVITYGTTNSGKTYTMFGTESEPGIVPRSIDFIYANLQVTSDSRFKPINGNRVVSCRKNDSNVNTKSRSNKEHSHWASVKRIGNDIHSIWLSFGEIYNEAVYDLLSEDHGGQDTRLKLVPDKAGTFVKGLRIVHAASAVEAHQILTAAISKLRVAPSSFNQNSSRSHAVFTIKLLKYYDGCSEDDVKVYTLNFYDLAGSGRFDNSTEHEQSFIESRYINKSLLALSRCVKFIAENNATKQNAEVVGPFRDSCLTRLLQKCLCEKENLLIFMNVNPGVTYHVESQNILSLVWSLRKVVGGSVKQFKRSDEPETTSVSRETSNWDMISMYGKDPDEVDVNVELRRENEILMKELTTLKCSMFNQECEIRREFAEMYVKMIKEHDDNWQKQMEDLDSEREKMLKSSIRQVEDYYEEKLNSITRKRKRAVSEDYERSLVGCDENCISTVSSLHEIVRQLRRDLETAVVEKNDCKFTLTLVEKELQMLKDARKSLTIIESNSLKITIDGEKNMDETYDLTDHSKVLDSIDEHVHADTSEIEELKRLLEDKNQHVQSEIEELKRLLEDKNQQVKTLEQNLAEYKTVNLQLMDKLETVEQILNDNNISTNVFDCTSDFRTSNIHASTQIFEDTTPSLMPTNEKTDDAPKIVARVPKEKLIFSAGDNGWNVTDSSIQKTDVSLMSSDSSKNDSGITSEGSKSDNEEKDKMIYIHDKVMELKNDYALLKDIHQTYRSRIAILSKEFDDIKHFISLMKDAASTNENKLVQYEEELKSKELEIERFRKNQEILYDRSSQTDEVSESQTQEYIKTMQELNERLKIHEGHDVRVAKFFEEYKEKAVFLEHQLSVACTHLEQNTMKCFSEHVPKIDSLEKELSMKCVRIVELDKEMVVLKNDLNALNHFKEKLNMLEDKVNKYNQQKDDIYQQLIEETRKEEHLDAEMRKLTCTIEERETKLKHICQDVEDIVNLNTLNRENIKILGNEVSNSTEKVSTIKEELSRAENFRINLERTIENEISNLCPQLFVSDKNVAYENSILTETDYNQLEVNRLKVESEQRDQDACLAEECGDCFAERSLGEGLEKPDEMTSSKTYNQIKDVPLSVEEEQQLEKAETKSDVSEETDNTKRSLSKRSFGSSTSSLASEKSEEYYSQKKSHSLCWTQ